jgi:hypothetical protein
MFIELQAQMNRFAPAERNIPFVWKHIALLRSDRSGFCGLAINIWLLCSQGPISVSEL